MDFNGFAFPYSNFGHPRCQIGLARSAKGNDTRTLKVDKSTIKMDDIILT